MRFEEGRGRGARFLRLAVGASGPGLREAPHRVRAACGRRRRARAWAPPARAPRWCPQPRVNPDRCAALAAAARPHGNPRQWRRQRDARGGLPGGGRASGRREGPSSPQQLPPAPASRAWRAGAGSRPGRDSCRAGSAPVGPAVCPSLRAKATGPVCGLHAASWRGRRGLRRLRACVPHPASAQAGRALRPSAGSGVRPRAPTPRAPPGASLPTLPFGSFPKTFAGSPGRPGPAAAAREVTTQLAVFPWQLWCCHEAPWREVDEAEEGIPGFSAARGHVLRHWSVAWRSRPSGRRRPCPAPPFTSPHSLPGLPPGVRLPVEGRASL